MSYRQVTPNGVWVDPTGESETLGVQGTGALPSVFKENHFSCYSSPPIGDGGEESFANVVLRSATEELRGRMALRKVMMFTTLSIIMIGADLATFASNERTRPFTI